MKWFKHIVSVITLVALAIMIYGFYTVDEKASGIIHSSLFAVYSLFTLLTILTYRISLIGRSKIKWTSLGLTILILISLLSMNNNKDLVYTLWDLTLAGYVLLLADAIFQIIPKKKPLSLITKASVSVLLLFLLAIIMFELGSPLAHYITEWLIILCSLLLVVNYFLKAKKA